MDTGTYIRLKLSTREKLKRIKFHSREPYDSVINRLIKEQTKPKQT